MKTKVIKHEEKFNPITLEITFETKEELDFIKKLIGSLSITKATELTGLSYPKTGDVLEVIYDSLKIN